MNLQEIFPVLLPRAVEWGEKVAANVMSGGTALNASGLMDARTVGVQSPERIRLLMVDRLPLPDDPELREAAVQTGLLGPTMAGLTLGYGIMICHGRLSRPLLSHECRHVAQYEKAGSIASFLPAYLSSIVQDGYSNCPYEQDARAHELPESRYF